MLQRQSLPAITVCGHPECQKVQIIDNSQDQSSGEPHQYALPISLLSFSFCTILLTTNLSLTVVCGRMCSDQGLCFINTTFQETTHLVIELATRSHITPVCQWLSELLKGFVVQNQQHCAACVYMFKLNFMFTRSQEATNAIHSTVSNTVYSWFDTTYRPCSCKGRGT